MDIRIIGTSFSVCKLNCLCNADELSPYCFLSVTDEEISLVCPTDRTPENTSAREDGWSMLRIEGQLDFSLIGILAGISKILADNGIGIFAISTYNTDYILTRTEQFNKALSVLRAAGYNIIGE